MEANLSCCAPLAQAALSEAQADELERVFKALADSSRVRILNILLASGEEELCACEFEEALGLKQALTSYHLKQLVDAGLITRQRRGTYSYYRLVEGALDQVRSLLEPAVAA